MTLQLARDLGVPEVEVIRAFPADRVMELDIARWEDLIQSFEAFGSVRVLVSNGAANRTVVFARPCDLLALTAKRFSLPMAFPSCFRKDR